MITQYCPKCRKVQNMLSSKAEALDKKENGEPVKRITVSYQCSVCCTFVFSEGSAQKVNSDISQGRDTGDDTMIDFSGVWVLDLEKSKLQSPPPEFSVFRIRHSEQSFFLDRTHMINGMPDHFTIELKTDRTEEKRNLGGMDITAKMYWDKDEFISDMIFRQGDEEATNVVKYSITDNGRTLIAEEFFTSSEHKHHNIWVFDRNEAEIPD